MKRTIGFCLIAAAIFALAACASTGRQYKTFEDFEYQIQFWHKGEGGTGTVTIFGYKGTSDTIVIPGTIEGLPVTMIGTHAFASLEKQLVAVTIPEGVVEIEEMAFIGNKLESLTIPASVQKIGDDAFRYNKLTSVYIPAGVDAIGDNVFYDNPITTLTVDPANPVFSSRDLTLLSKDGKTLLAYYGEETNYSIPEGITGFRGRAFFNNRITGVTIPESVSAIEDMAFRDNNQLTSITIPGTVSVIGDYAFEYSRLTNIVIQDGVKSIGRNAFANNRALKSITIPASVTSIGSAAFEDTRLSSVTLPEGLVLISDYAIDWIDEESGIVGWAECYTANGHKAGTYTLEYGEWSLNGGGVPIPYNFEGITSFGRGDTYIRVKNYYAAAIAYKQAMMAFPRDRQENKERARNNLIIAFYHLKKYGHIIQQVSFMKIDNKTTAAAYYFSGWAHDQLEEYTEAIADFTEGLKLDAGSLDLRFGRAGAYVNNKEYGNARADIEILKTKNLDSMQSLRLATLENFLASSELIDTMNRQNQDE